MHIPVVKELKTRGLMDSHFVGVVASARVWCVRDRDAEVGRVIGEAPMIVETHQWGLIYRQIWARLGCSDYQPPASVTRIVVRDGEAKVVLAVGSERQFDIVVGADGYRSVTHPLVERDATPAYCEYPAWRGLIDEAMLPHLGLAADAINAVGTERGHSLFYLVPGDSGQVPPGQRRLNWLWYDARAPEGLVGPFGVAGWRPGEGLSDSQRAYLLSAARERMPPWHAHVIESTPAPYMQPIFEREARRYAAGRVCPVGDADSIARPHTGSGTAKAIQDAFALGDALDECSTPVEALSRYDGMRRDAANALTRLGREMGEAQVTSCPPWSELGPDAFASGSRRSAHQRAYYVAASTGS